MYLGINFLDLPLGRARFSVDKYTLSPTAKGVSGLRRLFACRVCVTQLSIMASCAISRLFIACLTNRLTPGFGSSKGVIPPISMGIYPLLSSEGANPVELLKFELIANSVSGSFSTQ